MVDAGDEEKRDIASQVALTEIVHCKSEGQSGVSKAAKTCFEKHTKEVIGEFLKPPSDPGNNKIVVFVGGKARDLIYALAKKGGFKIEGESISSFYESKFGEHSKDARFLFVPHPNARQWKSRKSGELYKKLPNGIRQTIIDEELEQYGYSLPSD